MSMRYSLVLLVGSVTALGLFTGCNRGEVYSDTDADKSPATESAKDNYNPHDVPITEEQKTGLRREVAQVRPGSGSHQAVPRSN